MVENMLFLVPEALCVESPCALMGVSWVCKA